MFSIGDKVKIIMPGISFNGQEAIITRESTDTKGQTWIWAETENMKTYGFGACCFLPGQLQIVTRKTPPNNGLHRTGEAGQTEMIF